MGCLAFLMHSNLLMKFADKIFEHFCSNAHCLGMKDYDKYQEKAEDKDKDLEKNKDQI